MTDFDRTKTDCHQNGGIWTNYNHSLHPIALRKVKTLLITGLDKQNFSA